MTLTEVNPNDLSIDAQNERKTVENIDSLVDSIKKVGVIQPPIARYNEDDGYTVVIGQRRTLAAREAGLTDIPVIVMDWDDADALKASMTENMDLLTNRVPMKERAEALQRFWEMLGGEGMPVQSQLGNELGVPRETVRGWLEPLHEDWGNTSIDPTADSDEDDGESVGNELGERSIAEIRRMTGGGELGEKCVAYAEEHEMTQPQIKEARQLVNEGADPLDAFEQITNPDADENENENGDCIEAEIRLDNTSSKALRNFAEETEQPPAAIIVKAVQDYLERQQRTSQSASGTTSENSSPTPQTGSDKLSN